MHHLVRAAGALALACTIAIPTAPIAASIKVPSGLSGGDSGGTHAVAPDPRPPKRRGHFRHWNGGLPDTGNDRPGSGGGWGNNHGGGNWGANHGPGKWDGPGKGWGGKDHHRKWPRGGGFYWNGPYTNFGYSVFDGYDDGYGGEVYTPQYPIYGHVARCEFTYRNYNADTDRYLGYDGMWHRCVL